MERPKSATFHSELLEANGSATQVTIVNANTVRRFKISVYLTFATDVLDSARNLTHDVPDLKNPVGDRLKSESWFLIQTW